MDRIPQGPGRPPRLNVTTVTHCHCDECGATETTTGYRIPDGWKEILHGRHKCGNCLEQAGMKP